MSGFTIAPPADEAELAAALDIIALSLHFDRDLTDRFAVLTGRENFRILRRGSAVVGGLAIHPMGQWFGGRAVPMGGVAAVGIAPEHRAGGAATAMMRLAVRDMHARGVPLSTLYPATVPLYRRAGYELAGSRYEITIPLREMRLPRETSDLAGSLRIERITDDDFPAVESLYRDQAMACSCGALERGRFSWKRVYEPRGERARGYKVVNTAGEIEGIVFLLQKDESSAVSDRHANPPMFWLLVNEVQFTTARAGLRILELLQQHRSVCMTAKMYGSPDYPLLAMIPERTFTATHQFHWMTRIVDVERALTMRGWNRSMSGQITLQIHDDLIEANNDRFTISIQRGEATVLRDGQAPVDASIDIRGLAPLFTSHMGARDLMTMGLLRITGSGQDIAGVMRTIDGLFSGPRPWLADMF